MELSIKIKTPIAKNFIEMEGESGKARDVSTLTREQAEEYSDWVKRVFMENWESRANRPKDHGWRGL